MAWIRLIVPLILITICTIASPDKCTNPLPALMQLASGVDITAFDLFPDLGDSNSSHGLVENVFNFTCSGGKIGELSNVDLSDYDYPEQMSLTKQPVYARDQVSSMLDVTSVKRTLMARLGLEYNSESSFGAFSRNSKHTSLLKQHFVSNKVFSEIETSPHSLSTTITQVRLSHNFTEFITRKLPLKYEDSPVAYQTFVQRFGTHYFDQADLTFRMYAQFSINQDYLFDSSDEKIGANVRTAFYDYFKSWNLTGSWINNYKLVDKKEFANVSEIALTYSNAQMNDSRWVDKLTGTVYVPKKSNVVSIRSAKLKPIEQLIENQTIQAQVRIAVRVHRIRAQFDELTNIYCFSSKFYHMTKEEKQSFEKVIMFLNSDGIQQLKQIDQIVKTINELYDKALMVRGNNHYGQVIDDLYVIACAQLQFAKEICAFSIHKLFKGRTDRQCPDYEIVKGQQLVSDIYEQYHQQQSGSWELARSLNVRFGLRDQLTGGLKASCAVCPD